MWEIGCHENAAVSQGENQDPIVPVTLLELKVANDLLFERNNKSYVPDQDQKYNLKYPKLHPVVIRALQFFPLQDQISSLQMVSQTYITRGGDDEVKNKQEGDRSVEDLL